MATPEGKLKQRIKRRLLKQGDKYGVKVFVDMPPASQYGSSGRPDLYVDFGSIHMRIEVKANKNGNLSPNQEVWHQRHTRYHHGIPLYTICGEEEMEHFFEFFPMEIDNMKHRIIDAVTSTQQRSK